MTKKDIFTTTAITTGVLGIIGTAVYLFIKNKKNTQIIVDEDLCGDNDCTDTVEDEMSQEDTTDSVIPQDEDDSGIIHKFIAHLIKNGMDSEEVISMCETIALIDIEIPDHFYLVKEKMRSIMSSDFDIEKLHEFDKENFNLLYLSIDPCQLFIRNGFNILAMGIESEDNMMKLADALAVLQEEKPEEASHVMYEIYHIFNKLRSENITSLTYEEKFKHYVETYVMEESIENMDHVDGVDPEEI